ncbi:hypothetical protein EUX98_g9337 [Antrodiella citrinella]|uniref:Uncharacterized protein n=1 Tax=Antrodiella citrinella TaxID=2447956 RepID=A0A4S4LUW7_9APHY|nr:hypothetical protein EUX98_g9337 [Antrodiella citrinella]
MFNYLSFLRPPPQQASSSLPVTITPQLANDLRTELSDSTQDIFYSWSLLTQLTSNYPTATKPRKLTTWRAESAYKEILVPLPPGLRDGQSYILVLTVHDQGVPHVVNLARPSCGARPLPVMSMPILFTRGRQDPGKQEQIQRVYRIPTSPGNQVFLTVTEQTSFDLDKKIWDSGIGLSSWIVDLASGVVECDGLQDLKSKLIETSTDVLELGAGTGIVALAIASAMPLLEHNISRNEKLFTFPAIRPQAVVLDWDEPLPDEVHAVEGGFDVIV